MIVKKLSKYTKLKKCTKTNFMGICPFHYEETASFSVNQVDQLFYCFGCGVGGNYKKLVKLLKDYKKPEKPVTTNMEI